MRLLQFPGVAVAVLAAALVLALTATSGRLFLAAAGDAAVAQELERVGGVPALALVAFGGDPAAVAAVQAEAESVARIDAPGLGPPVRTRLGPALDVVAGARATGVRFAARDGFEAHIEVLDRAAGGGPLDPFWSPLASSIYDLSVARNRHLRCCWSTRTGSTTWPPGWGSRPARSGTSTRSRAGSRCRGPSGWPPRSGWSSRPPATRCRRWGSTGSPPARRSPPPWAAPTPPWPP